MQCREYKKWIHLNNTNELLDWEKIKLEEHLKTCSSCRQLFDNNETGRRFIHKLNKIEPVLTYPDKLTSDIMIAINEKGTYADVKIKLNMLLDFIVSYKVRILAFSIVIVLISLFSYQQLHIIYKLDRMERQITTKSIDNRGSVQNLSLRNNLMIKELVMNTDDELIFLDNESLDYLLKSYIDLKTDHDELLELLNENIEVIEKGLTKKDIQKLNKLLKEFGLDKKLSINL
ncbi:MAG: zf-HC2 domain-containing protein [Bacteroidales bacterium]|nr:zf-HC2 domain-containing protein [Bacteroidales bacterium]